MGWVIINTATYLMCLCVCVFYFFFWGGGGWGRGCGGLTFHLNLNDVLHTEIELFAYPQKIKYPNNREITFNIVVIWRAMQEMLMSLLTLTLGQENKNETLPSILYII